MTTPEKIKCLFGFHEYTIPHEIEINIFICKNCKRFGQHQNPQRTHTWWFEYDKNGNLIRRKNSQGYEQRIYYNKHGNKVYEIDIKGRETWYKYDKKGNLRDRRTQIVGQLSCRHKWEFNDQGKCIKHERVFT